MMILTTEKVKILGIATVVPPIRHFKLVTNKQLDEIVTARDLVKDTANRLSKSMELAIREYRNFNQEWEKHKHTLGVHCEDSADRSNSKVVKFVVSTPDAKGFLPVTHMVARVDGRMQQILVQIGMEKQQLFPISQVDAAETLVTDYLKRIKPFKRQ